jgi:anaerobic selenocysteine-containing dehydrogenase
MTIQQLHTYCAMCVSRCGVVATVEDGLLKQVHADPEHPNGCICVKGSAAPEIVYSPDRLQYPMRRTRPKGEQDPGWVRISRLRRQVPEPFLEIHPSTAKAAGIEDGEWVVLETAMGRVRLKAKFRDALHPQVVTTQYGWWQGCQELDRSSYDPFGPGGANVNLLTANEAIDPISGSVPHRSQRCRARKASVRAETAKAGV